MLIMLGATMFTLPDQLATGVLPVTLGVLAAFVAYGRTTPQRPRLRAAS